MRRRVTSSSCMASHAVRPRCTTPSGRPAHQRYHPPPPTARSLDASVCGGGGAESTLTRKEASAVVEGTSRAGRHKGTASVLCRSESKRASTRLWLRRILVQSSNRERSRFSRAAVRRGGIWGGGVRWRFKATRYRAYGVGRKGGGTRIGCVLTARVSEQPQPGQAWIAFPGT